MLRIEYERRVRRWPLAELARLTGMSESAISEFEKGLRVPSNGSTNLTRVMAEDQLERLAHALNVWPPRVLLNPVSILADPEERARVIEETA